MRNSLVILLILLAGCKDLPPPISQGKCLANAYKNAHPVSEICAFKGWYWNCKEHNECSRHSEITGELPKGF